MKNRTMVGAGVVAALACGLAFACGDTDETAPEDGGSAPDATADATPADGSTVDGSSLDGGLDGTLSDGGDGGDAETCPGPAGSLDPTFGDGGMVWLKYPGVQGFGVITQPDGKIVVAGSTQAGFALLRLLPNGALDPSFGTNGLVTTLIGVTGYFASVALQPDGKIVAVGGAEFPGGRGYDFAIARYLANGTLDQTFGSSGIATAGFGPGPFQDDYARSVAVLPDGRLVVGGFTETNGATPTENLAVAKFNSDGSPDSTFGGTGKVAIDVRGTADSPGVIVASSRGKLLIFGASGQTQASSTRTDISAARLNEDGSLDPSFGDGGVFVQAFGGASSVGVYDAKTDRNGRVVVAGTYSDGMGPSDFGLFGVGDGGGLDPTFGGDGSVLVDFSGRTDELPTILFEPSGSLLAVGVSGVGSQSDTLSIASTRYSPGGALDVRYGTGGRSLILPPPNASLVSAGTALAGCSAVVVGPWQYNISGSGGVAIGVAKIRR